MKFKQGIYKPVNESKYIQPNDRTMNKNIYPTYRSSFELKCFRYVDSNPAVSKWSAEPFAIPYLKPTDLQIHRYFIDVFIEFKSGDRFLVEIKPYAETIPPKKPKKITNKSEMRYQRAMETYLINQAKWEAARAYANKNNMKFIILTEKELF